MKILLLEDEYLLSRSIRTYLLSRGHFVDDFDNGCDVLETIGEKAYDFYILDINTPLVGGLECLKAINERYPETPKIIISAFHDIDHISDAYDLGCSDYLKKPFNLKELEIKITKLAEMVPHTEEESPIIPLSRHYSFDRESQQLYYDGEMQHFTPREHALLLLFIGNIGQVMTDDTIETFIWDGEEVERSTIRSLVNRLRSKLHEELIGNVRGFGYIMNRRLQE